MYIMDEYQEYTNNIIIMGCCFYCMESQTDLYSNKYTKLIKLYLKPIEDKRIKLL